jgi:hypothetical protein
MLRPWRSQFPRLSESREDADKACMTRSLRPQFPRLSESREDADKAYTARPWRPLCPLCTCIHRSADDEQQNVRTAWNAYTYNSLQDIAFVCGDRNCKGTRAPVRRHPLKCEWSAPDAPNIFKMIIAEALEGLGQTQSGSTCAFRISGGKNWLVEVEAGTPPDTIPGSWHLNMQLYDSMGMPFMKCNAEKPFGISYYSQTKDLHITFKQGSFRFHHGLYTCGEQRSFHVIPCLDKFKDVVMFVEYIFGLVFALLFC